MAMLTTISIVMRMTMTMIMKMRYYTINCLKMVVLMMMVMNFWCSRRSLLQFFWTKKFLIPGFQFVGEEWSSNFAQRWFRKCIYNTWDLVRFIWVQVCEYTYLIIMVQFSSFHHTSNSKHSLHELNLMKVFFFPLKRYKFYFQEFWVWSGHDEAFLIQYSAHENL